MKTIAFIITLLISTALWSQDLIAVQNGGEPTFYTVLVDAYTNAIQGDTIYLPGKAYNNNFTIEKEIHFVGVGHNPNATDATNKTIFTHDFMLGSNSDNGSITGIYMSSKKIRINESVSNYNISRCNISEIEKTNYEYIATGFIISENILRKVNIDNPDGISNNYYSNNIFTSWNFWFKYSSVKNNLFLGVGSSSYPINFLHCTVKNNIFHDGTASFHHCITKNNINEGVNGASSGSGTQGSGNFITDVYNLEDIFINYTEGEDIYTQDFHFVPGSIFTNAGTDGTDIGIYGGQYPWKDGSIPFNPHIQVKEIAPTTDTNGNLQINIQVQAQEK